MKRLALYTFGMFREPSAHPVNDGFHQRNDRVFGVIEGAAGFIARSGYEGDPGPESWGEQVYPRFYVERGDGYSPSTLSLWESPEAAMAGSYSGIHAEAMSHGRTWFDKPQWPPYVAWWVEGDHRPDWAEAVDRHEYLHDHGPSARAFDFKHPFDREGNATTIDRTLFKRLVEANGVTA